MSYRSFLGEATGLMAGPLASGRDDPARVAIIDSRNLFSECLAVGLQSTDEANFYRSYRSIAEWRVADNEATSLIVLCSATPELDESIDALMGCVSAPPFAIISHDEDVGQIIKYLERGARGFIPSSLPLKVVVQALRLIEAGGIFVPATSLAQVATRRLRPPTSLARQDDALSPKELSVAKALRRGTPNKVIASDLNMCESTVKVHVRNIMKKLMAKNRTEVAYLCLQKFGTSEMGT